MRIGTLSLAALAAAALVGCAPMTPRDMHPDISKARKCSATDCAPLEVTVNENVVTHTCEPVVDDLQFTGADGERTVHWRITTPGYEFSKEHYKFAIFVKSNPEDKFNGASTSGATLSLRFKHKSTPSLKWYAYVLTVRRADGTFCETPDPWLIS
jgi:hypothetical protein